MEDYLSGVEKIIKQKIIRKLDEERYEQKHVLVFLAGVDEINQLVFKFNEIYPNDQRMLFLPLHG